MWTQEEVRQAGRTRQRDRSCDCRAVCARVHAMQAASLSDAALAPEEDEDLAIEAAKTIVSGDAAKLRQLGVDLEFPEVATPGLALSRWVPRFWGAWQYEQNIQVMKAREMVMSLRRVALSLHGRDARQILIVDNLGLRLCFDWCRSKNFKWPKASYVDEPSHRCDPFPGVSHLLSHEFDRVGESKKGVEPETRKKMHTIVEALLVMSMSCVSR